MFPIAHLRSGLCVMVFAFLFPGVSVFTVDALACVVHPWSIC